MMKLEDVKLFIGIPCYGGQIYYTTTNSLLALTDVCRQLKIGMSAFFLGNESLIQRGRNRILSYFMAGDFTHMMFIDADVSFNAQDIVTMLQSEFEFTVGAYPKKEVVWDRVVAAVRCGVRPAEIPPYAASHVFNFTEGVRDGKENLQLASMGDAIFAEVQDGATGFMLLRRSVIEKMQTAYPETKYVADDHENYGAEPYALFDCGIEPESNRYLSEDFMFCRRWQRIGGKVWCCVTAKLDHTGTYIFEGDAARALGLRTDPDVPVEFVDPQEASNAA
jgi:hypothetical protein